MGQVTVPSLASCFWMEGKWTDTGPTGDESVTKSGPPTDWLCGPRPPVVGLSWPGPGWGLGFSDDKFLVTPQQPGCQPLLPRTFQWGRDRVLASLSAGRVDGGRVPAPPGEPGVSGKLEWRCLVSCGAWRAGTRGHRDSSAPAAKAGTSRSLQSAGVKGYFRASPFWHEAAIHRGRGEGKHGCRGSCCRGAGGLDLRPRRGGGGSGSSASSRASTSSTGSCSRASGSQPGNPPSAGCSHLAVTARPSVAPRALRPVGSVHVAELHTRGLVSFSC